MDVTTEAARALSDEALHAALAQVNLSIQHLEEHAKGRDNPAQCTAGVGGPSWRAFTDGDVGVKAEA